MLNPDGTKTCPLCKTPKLPTDFYTVGRRTGDGLSGYCRYCTGQKARQWQKENPEALSAIWERQRKAATPERKQKLREMADAWRIQNPERAACAQRVNAMRRKEKDPVLYRVKRAIHQNAGRARRKGVPTDFCVSDWYQLLGAFDNKCAWCGGSPPFLDLDHITSLHQGGHDTVGNIAPICRPCNSHKSYSTPEEFAAFMRVDLDELKRKCQVREVAATGTAA